MKKVNFNSLESFKVPEEWIEKAINAKPKKKPLLLCPYVCGTAASVVLVTVTSLLLFNSLKPSSFTPVAVSTTADADAATAIAPSTADAEKLTEFQTAIATESKAEPATENNTKPEPENKTEPATVQTAPAEIEPENETQPQTDDPSKIRIKEKWEVDTRAVKPNAGLLSADTPLLLSQEELFTGDITVIVSPDSPFYEEKTFRLDVTGEYSSDEIEVGGEVILEPVEGENGEKTVTFNLFKEGAYTPSTDYSFIFYNYDESGSKIDVKTLTEPLYSDNSITIIV